MFNQANFARLASHTITASARLAIIVPSAANSALKDAMEVKSAYNEMRVLTNLPFNSD